MKGSLAALGLIASSCLLVEPPDGVLPAITPEDGAGMGGAAGGMSESGGGSAPVIRAGTSNGGKSTAGGGASAGGAPHTAGAGHSEAAGAGGAATGGTAAHSSVRLIASNGTAGPIDPTGPGAWLDGKSNSLKIQGATYAYGDSTSLVGMMADFTTDGTACISGTAAQVDQKSTVCLTKMFTPPVTDCFGQFWGATVALNLNQSIDPVSMLGSAPLPYDASALSGFQFELSGATVPPPIALRFKVEDAAGNEYCTPVSKSIRVGTNSVAFSELQVKCYSPRAAGLPPNLTPNDIDMATGKVPKSNLVKIAWQVVTNTTGTVPFDFCVSGLAALK